MADTAADKVQNMNIQGKCIEINIHKKIFTKSCINLYLICIKPGWIAYTDKPLLDFIKNYLLAISAISDETNLKWCIWFKDVLFGSYKRCIVYIGKYQACIILLW